MSPIRDYPNSALELATVELSVLNRLTGSVATEIASQIPKVSEALLSSETDVTAKKQAKVDLMRFLSKTHPDEIKSINNSLMPAMGITFIPDNENPVIKLSINEIPDTDPVLRETMKFYNGIRVYKDLEVMLSRQEMDDMTVSKIENFLNNLNPKLQQLFMGNYPNLRYKSTLIFDFFQKFGFKGNKEQRKWEKSEKMTMGLHSFSDKLRVKILSTIADNKSLEEIGLTKSDIDRLFRETYAERRDAILLPETFSITDIVLNKTPLNDLDIK